MLAVLAPGQGSQSPGMLSPWLEDATVREQIESWSDISGLDLLHLGTSAGNDEVRDTAHAQPLIVATSILTWQLLKDHFNKTALLLAGHSVGEFSAAHFAGVLSAADAMSLVASRGEVMASASAEIETGMSAVLGGNRDEVITHLKKLNLEAANENGAGQIVAAGLVKDLQKLSEYPPAGCRVRRLEVAGAFHTHYMAPAQSRFQEFILGREFHDPVSTLLSNQDGMVVNSGSEVMNRLVSQISRPVRWDLCMKRMEELGVTHVVEVAPGGTLGGLIKRELPNVRTCAIKSPSDIESAKEFLEGAR